MSKGGRAGQFTCVRSAGSVTQTWKPLNDVNSTATRIAAALWKSQRKPSTSHVFVSRLDFDWFGGRLNCPVCSETGKQADMEVIPKESERFHYWQDNSAINSTSLLNAQNAERNSSLTRGAND